MMERLNRLFGRRLRRCWSSERRSHIDDKQVGVNKPRTQKSGFLKKPDFSALRLLGLIVPICLIEGDRLCQIALMLRERSHTGYSAEVREALAKR